MKRFERMLSVVPTLPPPLRPLTEISRNLWFAWNKEAIKLFQRLDPHLWRKTRHNPVLLLRTISQERVDAMAADEGFLAQIDRVYLEFDQYIKYGTNLSLASGKAQGMRIAYFSAEYGLTDCLPFYSGGLGVLAGDHLKSASDLRLPLIAVGLLYKKGFFSQYLDEKGWQRESYPANEIETLPISRVLDTSGAQRSVQVEFAGRPITAKIWKIEVGRVTLYLLDTDAPENLEYRDTSEHLYGGDRDMRIRQEILLGIGGVRALKALGVEATVIHMNEGHAAFATLEKIRQLIRSEGVSFREAKDIALTQCVFTTHTPVPAGNDRFDPAMIEAYFKDYANELGISLHDFMALGRKNPHDAKESFCMTVLALKLSCKANGVSKVHAKVSRKMWKKVWNSLPLEEIPIHPVTNGVHIPSWISRELSTLFDRYLGQQWADDPDFAKVWKRVDLVPDSELWQTHSRRREALVAFARRKLREQLLEGGAHKSEIHDASLALDTETLTIGFARRFATYKRGNLIFRDAERLAGIINNRERPVQFVFAGKAHPRDDQGKEIIRQIVAFTKEERFKGKIVFLENYNMNIARFMVQGVDIWLNNPLPPLEACGTSGMKASMNGTLNLSVLDGWWCEGYSGDNGWPIGRGEKYEDREYQDEVESRSIYNLLEREVVPLFYERGADNVPRKWIAIMKDCLRTICPDFNSHRMLENYTKRFYIPSHNKGGALLQESARGGKELSQWLRKVERQWNGIVIHEVSYENGRTASAGESFKVNVNIFLNGLDPGDVAIDLYHGHVDSKANFLSHEITGLTAGRCEDKKNFIFSGRIPCRETGRQGFVIRVLPSHENLLSPYQTGLIKWG